MQLTSSRSERLPSCIKKSCLRVAQQIHSNLNTATPSYSDSSISLFCFSQVLGLTIFYTAKSMYDMNNDGPVSFLALPPPITVKTPELGQEPVLMNDHQMGFSNNAKDFKEVNNKKIDSTLGFHNFSRSLFQYHVQ